MTYDVVIVGGGAAGVGVAVALKDAGIHNVVIIDRDRIGSSFDHWPAETQFITPSFPSNSIGMLDLNSIAIGVSPGFSMKVEHPTGPEYAEHLRAVAGFFELPVREQTEVQQIKRADGLFLLETEHQIVRSRHVIWAAGEFQYPRMKGPIGIDLCRHTATVERYADLTGDDFIIVGGFESGIDAAYHLAQRNKRVRVFDSRSPWDSTSSEPSVVLSPFTVGRMRSPAFGDHVTLHANTIITAITRENDEYVVRALGGVTHRTQAQPLWAGGFDGGHRLVEDLFEQRQDGFPLLNEHDESTITPGLFVSGPLVRHDDHIFCFIYKYRQRFAVVAKAIANSLGVHAEGLEMYRTWGMFLDDLSCCGEECVC